MFGAMQTAVEDTVNLTMVDGAEITIRRHGKKFASRLVLSHGNGLAMAGYEPFWRPLLDRYEIILFDFRNHGRNPFHGEVNHTWAQFALDLEAVCDGIEAAYGAKPAAGVFHSMAAITALLHAQRMRWRWQALVLFEPPLYPYDGHPLQAAGRAHEMKMADWSLTRPDRFASPQVLADAFAKSWSLRRWVPEAYQSMAHAILQPDHVAGDWRLSCPGALESRIYRTNVDPDIWPMIADIPGPIQLICSDPQAPGADVNGRINIAVAQEQGLACNVIADTSHFLQIERPDACVAAMERFLGQVGFPQQGIARRLTA